MGKIVLLERKTVKIGDVFHILTSKGVCYGQVTYFHPKLSAVVSIFREFYPKKPKNFTTVVSQEPQFITTFLIQYGVRQGLFSLAANVPVADHLKKFPIFRGTNNIKNENPTWFFWDGEKEWRVDRPLTEQEKNTQEVHSFPVHLVCLR
ncbi:hypothetical protein J2X72_003056 [Phyllobacterium sp. 1468]|uniref:hypothetical protein n=1 Tax=Phyllobacterium sp. 1468 TaxID=2817759 RepID=UPI0028617270|nr:hypothetical protein [Phyllobacterium sp. 1468]MDR6634246.1 hypothetical protein [Phyllobacterium sp. 1468]